MKKANNMASGGEPDDTHASSHGSRRRPLYDGSIKAYPAWAMKAESYARKQGIDTIMLKGESATPSAKNGDTTGGKGSATGAAAKYWIIEA